MRFPWCRWLAQCAERGRAATVTSTSCRRGGSFTVCENCKRWDDGGLSRAGARQAKKAKKTRQLAKGSKQKAVRHVSNQNCAKFQTDEESLPVFPGLRIIVIKLTAHGSHSEIREHKIDQTGRKKNSTSAECRGRRRNSGEVQETSKQTPNV